MPILLFSSRTHIFLCHFILQYFIVQICEARFKALFKAVFDRNFIFRRCTRAFTRLFWDSVIFRTIGLFSFLSFCKYRFTDCCFCMLPLVARSYCNRISRHMKKLPFTDLEKRVVLYPLCLDKISKSGHKKFPCTGMQRENV